jgi:hypothetical protein
MTEIGIMTGTMGGDGTETETEAAKETERGIGIEIGIETVTASEMMIIAEIETERGMGGKGSAGTETVAGTGAVQGAWIGETETVKTESTVEDVAVVAAVLEGLLRMMARGRTLRSERKRKRRRAAGMVLILTIQRL